MSRTCQTFSLAPSNEAKRMLTPSSPWPPHLLFGVSSTSLMVDFLELYTIILSGLSIDAFSISFSVSLF